MLPRVANTLHTEGSRKVMELLSKSAEFTLFLTCVIAFGIGAISDSFLPFFFGKGYESCITLIKVFVPVLFIKALSDFIRTQYLISTGKDKLYIIAVLGGAVSNVIVNYIMILRCGVLGAVIGTSVAEIIVLVIQVIGVNNELPLKEINWDNLNLCIIWHNHVFNGSCFVNDHLKKRNYKSRNFYIVWCDTVYGSLHMLLADE